MIGSNASQIGGRHVRACNNHSVRFRLDPHRQRRSFACAVGDRMHEGSCLLLRRSGSQSRDSKKVAEIRARVAAERAQGKAIGYLSIPISSAGGGYDKVNGLVAKEVADRVVARLGARAAWVLNTASDEVKLSGDARGPEYMLMLTQVLEGEDGLGRDFDFVYFVGPSEFAKFFGLMGANDLENPGSLLRSRVARRSQTSADR